MTTDIQVGLDAEGYYYETNGQRFGPYSITDQNQLDFIAKLAKQLGVQPKDVLHAQLQHRQRSITIDEILNILSTTIKRDNPAKAILFLAMINTYTEQDQQNIALQAESASGKSYLPLEIAEYFPDEDKIILAAASPTAFFHEQGVLVDEQGNPIDMKDRPSQHASDEEKAAWRDRLEKSHMLVNLEQMILIFLDQPHYSLMEKLRPLLSHDQKELHYKITDKSQKFGLKTKHIVIRGFPTIIFCSTKLQLDDQEKTRVFLLSPSVEEDKLLESIHLLGQKLGNRDHFKEQIKSNARRLELRQRIQSIRTANIRDVIIDDWEHICQRFIHEHPHLAPRHQRDFPRLFSLIKSHALLNHYKREHVDNGRIKAIMEDVDAGFHLYNLIAKENELGVSPHVFQIYQKVIQPLLSPEQGVARKTIHNHFYQIYHRSLSDEKLRREILPCLEVAGLILQDHDPTDKRKMLVYPPDRPPISLPDPHENNRGSIRGVTTANQSLTSFDILEQLRKFLPLEFREHDFVTIAKQLNMNTETATTLFHHLVKQGEILRNPEGFWLWQ